MSGLEIRKALHKIQRLGTMDLTEIAHRVREKSYTELERFGLAATDPKPPEDFGRYLAGEPSQRFYAGCRHEAHAAILQNAPGWIRAAVQHADRICEHKLDLFSRNGIDLGNPIDWHRDPVTGQIWEKRFWSDYQVENDPAGRDPKNIHELNRHQHLPRLAKAFNLTRDNRYAIEALSQMESWVDQNPTGIGINWQCAMEIGLRVTSWLWTLFLLAPTRLLYEGGAQRIGASLFSQLEHIYRHTSLYSSPNTHLISEATALFIGGLVFQDQKRAAAWRDRGAELLIQESERQILPDGFYGELSSYYHCYALDFYLQALILADRNHFPLPMSLRNKVESMVNVLMHLTRPDGTLPLLGDDDGGRALVLDHRTSYRSFREALCMGAVLFQRGDFKSQAGVFFEQALWLLGVQAGEDFYCLPDTTPAETSVFFRDAGYAVQRSGWGPSDSHLCFDCGGMGMGKGTHAHADALSVTLFANGKDLLVDPGTFVYNGAEAWRDYFRSTRAHNTVTIDGQNQAEPEATFRWKTKVTTKASRRVAPYVECVEGEHDGYGAREIVHRRRVLRVGKEYWILIDDFRGSGDHSFTFSFHLAPDVRPTSLHKGETNFSLQVDAAGFFLGSYASVPMTSTLVRGQTEPVSGWMSRGYGQKGPCATLQANLKGSPSIAVMTFLSAAAAPLKIQPLELQNGSAVGCRCEHRGVEDTIVASDGAAEIITGGFRMQGELFWIRRKGAVVQQIFTIQPRTLDYNGQSVLEDACAQSVA